jgi:hypothetical protein
MESFEKRGGRLNKRPLFGTIETYRSRGNPISMLLSPVLANEQECFFISVNARLTFWQFLTLERVQQRMRKPHFRMSYNSPYGLS